MGANYLGNIHNDTAAVIEALDLPELTFPVVGLTVGWPNQDPQLKPRMPKKFRVMENGYQRPESWTEALKDYDGRHDHLLRPARCEQSRGQFTRTKS